MINTDKIIEQIRSGNLDFCQSNDNTYFKLHMEQQSPAITMVSCSDSRVQSNALIADAVNKVFTIRNIGNQISSVEGSVDYGIYHLKTPVLLIVGHSECGAVKAWHNGYTDEPVTIQRELDRLSPAFTDEDDRTGIVKSIMNNLEYQVQVAMSKYADLVTDGTLTIVGAYYDFANDLGNGYGKLNIITINGKVQ